MTTFKVSMFDADDAIQLSNGVLVYNGTGINSPGDSPYSWGCCFGFVNNHLYIGDRHHAWILYNLIEGGQHDFESLMNAKQLWGWARAYSGQHQIILQFTTDEAAQTGDEKYAELCRQSFEQYFHCPTVFDSHYGAGGYASNSEYGQRMKVNYTGELEECYECGRYFDPDDPSEARKHSKECPECGESYAPCDSYQDEEHNNPYCTECYEHYDPSDAEEHEHKDEDERYGAFRKTAEWIYSWVYDATTKQIHIGHDHIDIFNDIPDVWDKAAEGKIICGWWVRDYPGVSTRIMTDTVDTDYARNSSPIAKEAQEAAMKYWQDHNLAEELGGEEQYCPECGDEVSDEDDHYEYCHDCGTYYYGCDYDESNRHSQDYCPECNEHVYDIDEHNKEEHFQPEPWMPQEGSEVTYKGKRWLVYDLDAEGMFLTPYLPGGQYPAYPYKTGIQVSWEDYKESLEPWKEVNQDQQALFSSFKPIVHCTDLNDDRVFAILSKDYLTMGGTRLAIATTNDYSNFNTWSDWDDFVNQYNKNNGLTTVDPDSSTIPAQETGGTDPSDTSQIDDPRMLAIAKDPKSLEYRWSYDGQQLHIWRVHNRSSFGPSHYDMFGSNGYENHSQGRVYVSPQGVVGTLYWQISHPECEQVVNEWVLKTYGKMPDYVYRAYGPYAGEVRPRWMFPIVEVSGLPVSQKERWWETPGATGPKWYDKVDIGNGGGGSKKNKGYPAPKQKKQYPGPVDYNGDPINPGKAKRTRRRSRNRKYRNRSFGRR